MVVTLPFVIFLGSVSPLLNHPSGPTKPWSKSSHAQSSGRMEGNICRKGTPACLLILAAMVLAALAYASPLTCGYHRLTACVVVATGSLDPGLQARDWKANLAAEQGGARQRAQNLIRGFSVGTFPGIWSKPCCCAIPCSLPVSHLYGGNRCQPPVALALPQFTPSPGISTADWGIPVLHCSMWMPFSSFGEVSFGRMESFY